MGSCGDRLLLHTQSDQSGHCRALTRLEAFQGCRHHLFSRDSPPVDDETRLDRQFADELPLSATVSIPERMDWVDLSHVVSRTSRELLSVQPFQMLLTRELYEYLIQRRCNECSDSEEMTALRDIDGPGIRRPTDTHPERRVGEWTSSACRRNWPTKGRSSSSIRRDAVALASKAASCCGSRMSRTFRRTSVPVYVYGSELSGIQRLNLRSHLFSG